MMRFLHLIACLTSILAVATSVAQQAAPPVMQPPATQLDPALDPARASIVVFAISTTPVRNVDAVPGVRVVYLDGLDQLTRSLSQGLPRDRAAAEAEAKARMARLAGANGKGIQAVAAPLAAGLGLGMQIGIDRVPAVVFDRSVVVYGEADVAVANSIYQRWKTGAALRQESRTR